MAQEPAEAPQPNLAGFANDAGSAFSQRMKEMSKGKANPPQEAPKTAPVEPLVQAPTTATAPAVTPVTLQAPSTPAAQGRQDDRHVKPTVLSVDASIVERFEAARKNTASHTGLILQAVEATYQRLPQLILDRRPKPPEGGLFGFRPTPGETESERRLPIRIRPLVAELKVIDDLVAQCQRAVDPEVNRSEMVAAALDAHLPELPKRRRRRTAS